MKRLFAMMIFFVSLSVPSFALSDTEYLSMKKNNTDYARAESELTRLWNELKSSLSVQAFDDLKREQLAWIKTERDEQAESFLVKGYSRAEAYTFVTEKRADYLRGKLKNSSPLFARAAYAYGDAYYDEDEADNEADSSYGVDVKVTHGNVINDTLNVRNKPGVKGSRVIYHLDNGEDVYVHKIHKVNGADWYYVNAAFEREGWVSGNYIQLDPPASASEEVTSNLPSVSTDTNIASTDNPSENSNLNEPSVVVSKDIGSDPNFDIADKLVGEGKIPMYVRDKGSFIRNQNFKYVHVTGSTVNLRSQPNAKANILGKARTEDKTGILPYLGEWTHPNGDRWILAERSRKSVWIFGKYAKLLDEAGYKDVLRVQARQIKRGDVITFGVYEQDDDYSNGKEPIEWIVLDKKGNEVLLISKYCLDRKIYNPMPLIIGFFMSTTWEESELREWLNSDFLNTAFDATQQRKISRKRIKNLDNTKYGTKGGKDTDDKVFLLSINEAVRYFSSNKARQASPTLYALYKGADVSNGACNWWLRSPGYFKYGAATVHDDGSVSYSGAEPDVGFITVRPALWLDISQSY